MVTPELIDYVKKQKEKAVPDQTIKESLLSVGWTENQVEEALIGPNILQEPQSLESQPARTTDIINQSGSPSLEIKKSSRRFGIIIIIVVHLIIISGIGYYYIFQIMPKLTQTSATNILNSSEQIIDSDTENQIDMNSDTQANNALNNTADQSTIDKFDDSDQDGLSDYQETNIYGTNTSNSDTDLDGFLDGDEVKNGYNPNGSGRLLDSTL